MTISRPPQIPPEHIRAEITAFLISMGVPDTPDQTATEWLRDMIRCVRRWQQWRDHVIKTAATALVGIFVVSVAGWLGMALMRWSGAGW